VKKFPKGGLPEGGNDNPEPQNRGKEPGEP
jgi:hypothetical protein